MALAMRVAKKLEVGNVAINSSLDIDMSSPFGRKTGSGLEREAGQYGLKEYLEAKTTKIKSTGFKQNGSRKELSWFTRNYSFGDNFAGSILNIVDDASLPPKYEASLHCWRITKSINDTASRIYMKVRNIESLKRRKVNVN